MKYRAEIDGLRALAIIPVVLFHAGFKLFKGGFVGVDIFFVISGYLITAILLSEIDRGEFSLIHFYERRARRILPALFLVMLATMIGAWLWLPPPNMVDFSKSLVASSYFVSNILFWLETGYWGTANELKPLLHTWTLAIDAQFYLLFPILLLAIRRWGKTWMPICFMGIGMISLLASQWGAYHLPSANFFLLPTRIWELMIGAGVAYFLLYSKPITRIRLSQKLLSNGLAILGMILILFAIFSFNETIPFPSIFALFPALGTALILLFASPQNLLGQFLGTRILVGIGAISYSLYLWHHPLLSFARHTSLTEPSALLRIALVMLSFPLAYLSWQFVEKPFRTRAFLGRKGLLLFWLLGTLAFSKFGVTGYATDGFVGRLQPSPTLMQVSTAGKFESIGQLSSQDLVEQIQLNAPPPDHEPSIEQYNYGLSVTCDTSFTLSPDCRTSDTPEILVWGDSFAMQLVPGILAAHPEVGLIQMTKSACGPFFDIAPITEPNYPASWARECLAFTEQLRQWLKDNKTIHYAVLASPFSQYLLEDRKLMLRNGEHSYTSLSLAIQEFKNTLTALQSWGITPVIFAPPPATELDIGRCLTRAEWMGIELGKCNFRLAEIAQERIMAYGFLRNFEHDYRVIWLDKLLCGPDQCQTHLGTTRLYRDGQHLTQEGAIALGKQHDFYRLITGEQSH